MTKPAWSRRVLPTSPFARDEVPVLPPVQFEVGDRVSHDRHGLGRVVTVGRDEVVIDFGASRRRVQTSSSMLNKL